jgi:hypothetical protein
MKTIGTSWRHNLNERTHERVQIFLPALPATFGVRRAVLGPRNSMSGVSSSDSDSLGAWENCGLQTRIGQDVGDVCGAGKRGGAEEGRAETGDVNGSVVNHGGAEAADCVQTNVKPKQALILSIRQCGAQRGCWLWCKYDARNLAEMCLHRQFFLRRPGCANRRELLQMNSDNARSLPNVQLILRSVCSVRYSRSQYLIRRDLFSILKNKSNPASI